MIRIMSQSSDDSVPLILMERLGKVSQSNRSFGREFWQRHCHFCGCLGDGWSKPIGLRERVTEFSNFKDLLSALNRCDTAWWWAATRSCVHGTPFHGEAGVENADRAPFGVR